GGVLVDPSVQHNKLADILIRDGRVAAIGQNMSVLGRQVIAAEGKTVIPGLIDLHTHLREPGGETKETVLSGSRAAAAGGYTGITALPNIRPVMDDGEKVKQQNTLAKQAGLVRIWPVGAVTKDSAGGELADIAEMVRQGARAVTDDGRGVRDAEVLRRALLLCRRLDIPLLEHCEDESLAADGQLHDGAVAKGLGLPGISVSSETVMLARDLLLAAETGSRVHIMHVSTAAAAEMIRRAKEDGIPVTAEVTPHHLLLTEEAADGYNTMAKMKPPLRTSDDVDALRQALAEGTIDAVATDHAPHTTEEKARDFTAAPFGIVGLETAFTLLYTYLVRPGHISLLQLVDRMSCRPAAILGVPYGTLRPGSSADLVIIDTDTKTTIDKNKFYSKGKNTPFHGWPVTGTPVLTMIGGRVIMQDGLVETGL
ncbi:MAG: dihydroorotase, partial [Bacillota bacterium]|nr:dihydroorotase [Bacillota bacterium]